MKNNKKIIHYIVAFIIPIIIFSLAMASRNLYPFGSNSLRFIDALSQYPDFFEGLRSFSLFNFNLGLGSNFYSIFTTYLLNPLNIIYLFFKKEDFDLFLSLIILIKIGLSGLTMNIFLNYKQKLEKDSFIFSTIYALSGFASAYFFNYQFLDAIYMLPIIMLGVKKMLLEGKNGLYYGALAYMIMIHYYTAFICCLFIVLYFFFQLYTSNFDKIERHQKIKKFFLISFLSGLTASFVIIPTAFDFILGRVGNNNIQNYFRIDTDVVSSLFNFNSGVNFLDNYYNFSAPSYITIFIVIGLIGIFNCKDISKKYKKAVFIMVLIYIVSLSFNGVYATWHLMQFPSGYPGRFVFCFDAFFVTLVYQFYKKIKFEKKKLVILLLIFSDLLIWWGVYIKNNSSFMMNIKIYEILLIVNIMLIIYYVLTWHNKRFHYVRVVIVMLELFINLIMNFNVLLSLSELKVIDYRNFVADNTEKFAILDDSFYRFDYAGDYNRAMLYHKYGVSYYASLYNENLKNFLGDYALHMVSSHAISYNGDFLMNALLGIKYTYNRELLENKYVINSLGFVVSNQNKEALKTISNPLDIFNLVTNNKYNLKLQEVVATPIYENIKKDEEGYSLIDSSKNGKITFIYHIPIDCVAKLNSLDGENNIELNDKPVNEIYLLKKNDVVKYTITIPKDYLESFYFLDKLEYLEEKTFKALIDELNDNNIKDIKINGNGFTGVLESTSDKQLLLITIPYDKRLEFKIDNQKVVPEKYLNGLIGIELDAGVHEIKMTFQDSGLKIGIILSFLGIILFGIEQFNLRKRSNSFTN